jgi:hypothetical protein
MQQGPSFAKTFLTNSFAWLAKEDDNWKKFCRRMHLALSREEEDPRVVDGWWVGIVSKTGCVEGADSGWSSVDMTTLRRRMKKKKLANSFIRGPMAQYGCRKTPLVSYRGIQFAVNCVGIFNYLLASCIY